MACEVLFSVCVSFDWGIGFVKLGCVLDIVVMCVFSAVAVV